MAASAERFDPRRLAGGDEIDVLFGTANPNPDRVGCPPADTLAKLTRRQLPMDDPAYVHLTECSPCYREFRSLQQSGPSFAGWLPRSNSARWIAAGALLLVLAISGWFYGRSRGGPTEAPAAPVVATSRPLELDLRPYTVSRRERGTPTQPPLALTAERIELTLLLPVGSEPGPHDVRLLGAGDRVFAQASGQAAIRDFVTTLRVEIDLGAVPAGDYRLAVRRDGDDWSLYPTLVR